MSFFEELKWRNLIVKCSDEKKARELLDGKKSFKFYCGFDPTAGSLTVGHLVQIITFLLLQKKGHHPIVLLGGFTSLIGDPKKTEERKLLNHIQISKNIKKITLQFQKFLVGDQFEILNNYEWLSKIDILNFFRIYGKSFNINYMLNKEVINERLKHGLSYSEFSYMLLQSIDFQYLFQHQNVKMQFGGSDQWGNITSGLELIRKNNIINYDNKPIGIINSLLLNADGTKFGKSEEGTLWLDEKLTSPYKIYQYFLNIDDKDVVNFLKSLTLLSKNKILELQQKHLCNPKKRLLQNILAKEIVTFLHGKEVFQDCFKTNQALFFGKLELMEENFFDFLKNILYYVEIEQNISLLDALVLTKLTTSKNKAKDLILNSAIKICNKKVHDTELILDVNYALFKKYILLNKGKKFNALLIFK